MQTNGATKKGIVSNFVPRGVLSEMHASFQTSDKILGQSIKLSLTESWLGVLHVLGLKASG